MTSTITEKKADLLLIAREELDLVLRALVEETSNNGPHNAGNHGRCIHDHESAEYLGIIVLIHLADALQEGDKFTAELHQAETIEVDDAQHRADAT